mmetsp:Transcript_54370/g.175795  ORF Transcript_54370/g.175795 Transcript_54370/m.175795 type:complete len:103 (+) Transcript_54370:40-348(+)
MVDELDVVLVDVPLVVLVVVDVVDVWLLVLVDEVIEVVVVVVSVVVLEVVVVKVVVVVVLVQSGPLPSKPMASSVQTYSTGSPPYPGAQVTVQFAGGNIPPQ